jgi:hypothetical protein
MLANKNLIGATCVGLAARKKGVDYLEFDIAIVDEVVCYSTVRTDGSLKFLLDRKRLNVACSRAKENLVFFGYRKYLEHWKPRKEKNEVNLFRGIIDRSRTLNLKELIEAIHFYCA